MTISRRALLRLSSLAALTPQTPPSNRPRTSPAAFSFVHLTDTHIQPERRATEGCKQCIGHLNRLGVDFAIHGGDLVYDVAETDRSRARLLYALWRETTKRFEMPLHSVIGNHDVYGLRPPPGTSPEREIDFGKRMFEEQIGRRYYAFDHKGWHFIVLDSVTLTRDTRMYTGGIDDEQIDWLKADLDRVPATTNMILATHLPLASGFMQTTAGPRAVPEMFFTRNAKQVLALFEGRRLKAVLQGHTHIAEVVDYRGCKFITSGAVSGAWWEGARSGNPEGYGVVTVSGDDVNWRYQTYGFVADPK